MVWAFSWCLWFFPLVPKDIASRLSSPPNSLAGSHQTAEGNSYRQGISGCISLCAWAPRLSAPVSLCTWFCSNVPQGNQDRPISHGKCYPAQINIVTHAADLADRIRSQLHSVPRKSSIFRLPRIPWSGQAILMLPHDLYPTGSLYENEVEDSTKGWGILETLKGHQNPGQPGEISIWYCRPEARANQGHSLSCCFGQIMPQ